MSTSSPSFSMGEMTITLHLEEEVTCLLAGRIRLWHHLKTSAESNSSSLDRQSLLLNSKFSRPKMMSCSFEKLQFLEYYQEKKSSSLNSVRPQGVLRKRLFLRAAWATLLSGKLSFWLYFVHILTPWKHYNPKRLLIAVSSPGHKNSMIISFLQPQRQWNQVSKTVPWVKTIFPFF